MSQCLRCSKPCIAAGVFCDECRALLQMGMQQVEVHVSGKPLERISDSRSIANVRQKSSPLGDATYASGSEQAVDKSNTAQRNRRMPRASRLTPIHDISADIQRESTPKLKASEATSHMRGRPLGSVALKTVEKPQKADNDRHQPYIWPWLQDTYIEESDSWATRTDPLKSRHLPNKAEAARIEKEDIRRAQAEQRAALSGPRLKLGSRRMRIAFSVLAIVILLALTLDLVLIFLAFVHPGTHVAGGMPMLTLSPNKATIGQSVRLHISNFPPTTDVLVTHDVGEAVHTNTVSPLIKVGSSGTADVELVIDSNWGPGFHTIEAEDVTTRYTTSTTLQVIGSGSTKPSHLFTDNTFLNMGSDVQYANTIQTLVLRNSGGGSISWVASSNKPWLLTTPTQGTFSTSQAISIAVARTNLKPGDYKGTLTISSNVGAAHVKIGMTVLPLSTTAGPVLVVAPAVFTFVSTDGGADPNSQLLTISNPGSQALNWSLSSNTPTSAGPSSPTPISTTNWVSTDVTAGTVAAHATGFVHIIVHSQNVLPGTYTDTLVFGANQGTLNNPQEVPVSLTIQPRCGLTINTGGLLFTAVSGQANPGNQTLGLSASAGCSDTTRWQATYTANWLTLAPTSGQLKGTAVASVGVNVGSLNPGTYSTTIAFSAGQSTQNVSVQLIVQAPPAASAPIMGISSPNLNFSNAQGQANPPGQVVTITNNGGSPLYWHTTTILLGTSWLGAAPTGGVIAAGQTGHVTVRVDTSQLTPATYMGQIILNGTDATGAAAAGSPQTIAVNLVVQTPCALAEPSSSSLSFSAIQGTIEPVPQVVTVVAAGNCGWPLRLHASITNAASWLALKLSDHVLINGQSVTILAMTKTAGLAPGSYTAQISIDATDGPGILVQGSPKFITVTLTVT